VFLDTREPAVFNGLGAQSRFSTTGYEWETLTVVTVPSGSEPRDRWGGSEIGLAISAVVACLASPVVLFTGSALAAAGCLAFGVDAALVVVVLRTLPWLGERGVRRRLGEGWSSWLRRALRT
jgi:hypothetical protein